MNTQKSDNLFQFRWIIPIIGVIYHQKGTKFVTLRNRLNVSRSVLASTLKKLIKQGIIMRNPGYGHPLRPEYLLTSEGIKFGPFCNALMVYIREQNAHRLVQSRWALRILYACRQNGIQFSELKSRLPLITPRALSEKLKLLISEGYIKRQIIDHYPPLTIYRLTALSTPYIRVLNQYKDILTPHLS